MLHRCDVFPFLVVISVPLSPSPRPAPTRPASEPSLLTFHALPLTRSRQLQCREVRGANLRAIRFGSERPTQCQVRSHPPPYEAPRPSQAPSQDTRVWACGGRAPSQTAPCDLAFTIYSAYNQRVLGGATRRVYASRGRIIARIIASPLVTPLVTL